MRATFEFFPSSAYKRTFHQPMGLHLPCGSAPSEAIRSEGKVADVELFKDLREQLPKSSSTLLPQRKLTIAHRISQFNNSSQRFNDKIGSCSETVSRELLRRPLLLRGKETNPVELSSRKSQGLTDKSSPVLKRAWNPKRIKAPIVSSPCCRHHPAIAKVISCVRGGARHGTSYLRHME